MQNRSVSLLFACLLLTACSGEPATKSTANNVPETGAPREENPAAINKDDPEAVSADGGAPAEEPQVDTDSGTDTGGETESPVEADAAPAEKPACGEPPAETFTPPAKAPADLYPQIKHWELPAADVVALTFDDGPNPATTNKILDVLRTEKIRATFFINSRATTDLRTSSAARETLQRIVDEGHVLGNHTASHYDLRDASVDVEAQLRFVEEDVRAAAPCAPPLTLIRVPFGQPHLAGTDADKARVFPILARHGVHIGWTIESLDYECNDLGPSCVVDRVNKRLNLGKRGALLMHDTQPVTVTALPLVIAEIRKRGIGFVTAERLVRDKYGKSSAQLVADYVKKTGG